MPETIRITWCRDPSRAGELASFFARNVGPEYISHAELQGPRAASPNQWHENLGKILLQEIEPRLATARQLGPSKMDKLVLTADGTDGLLAVSLVTFADDAPVPFATVEDLVVRQSNRGQGIGKSVMEWIVAQALARNVHRLFLESGSSNERAHHFFEREGFRTCSIVMMRSI